MTRRRFGRDFSEQISIKALGASFAPARVPTPDELNVFHSLRDSSVAESQGDRREGSASIWLRGMRGGGLVAGVLAATILVTVWRSSASGPDYKTPVGGLAAVPMTDGSRVTLNTDSAIRVQLTNSTRQIQLDRGEAFFEVAKDSHRPFIVSAGTKRVIAVGTKFAVRRNGDDIQIVVTARRRNERSHRSRIPSSGGNGCDGERR
jgi:transmembrane sensor